MRFGVVIYTPHKAQLYAGCFDDVADALVHSLRALGHEADRRESYEGMSCESAIPIVLRPQFLDSTYALPPNGSILYNFEQVDHTLKLPLDIWRQYAVWDGMAASNADRLTALGIDARRVPLGHVPQLERFQPVENPDIDVFLSGSISPRRQKLIREVRKAGIRAAWVFGAFGKYRDRLMARAKIVLSAHYFDHGVFEPTRNLYALGNRCFVLAENGRDGDQEWEGALAFAPYEEMVEAIRSWINRSEERRRIAERGHAILRSRPMAAYLQEALLCYRSAA